MYIYIYTHTFEHDITLNPKTAKFLRKQRGEALPDRVEPAKKAKRISSAGTRGQKEVAIACVGLLGYVGLLVQDFWGLGF